MEHVILVDEKDSPIGVMEKMEAHQKALLHRAFSGFVFNDKHQLLLQRRALTKYHNPGIWSNTVCSHPKPNEIIEEAVSCRLNEELGFFADFSEVGSFIYKSAFDNGLTENECDHVFVAKYSGLSILPNPEEVCDYMWISKVDLEREIEIDPGKFSFWLNEILNHEFINPFF